MPLRSGGCHPGGDSAPVPDVSLPGRAAGLLAAGVGAVGAGYLSAFLPGGAPVWGTLLVVGGTALSLAAAMALGAGGGSRSAGLLPVFAFVFLVVGGGFALLLFLPPADPAEPTLLLGLPLRAALLLYGIGLVPVLVVPLAYARSFDRLSPDDEEMERIRELARREEER